MHTFVYWVIKRRLLTLQEEQAGGSGLAQKIAVPAGNAGAAFSFHGSKNFSGWFYDGIKPYSAVLLW
jgi:hypothetical protein